MQTLYIVVYGQKSEDIMYFTCFEKAKMKLIIQSVNNPHFSSVMFEYNEQPNGVYGQTKAHWRVPNEHIDKLKTELLDPQQYENIFASSDVYIDVVA